MSWFSDIREAWREADPKNYRTLTGHVFNLEDYSSWGHNMYFSDIDAGQLVGWIDPLIGRPMVNDEIRSKMASGKVARFVVKNVAYMSDPRDMFYATVDFIGYIGEPLTDKWVLEATT